MLWRIPADTHEQRIGIMSIFFSVILSRADLIRAEAKACPERSRRDLMPVASDEILRFAQDDNSKHHRPATKVSATKVSPRPPAIAKSLAEIAGIAEIASSRNSVSPSSAQRACRARPADLGRAVAQLRQHRVGMLAVPEAAVRAFNEIFSAH